MKNLLKINLAILFLTFTVLPLMAQEKQDEKLQKSAEVLKEFAGMKETIPQQLMDKAEGIVVIPGLIKAGFGIGGQRGRGVAMVKNADGKWSDPVFVTLTGGSVGFQAGVQSIDLILVFTKGSVLTSLAKGEFTLGGSASVAAGPVGRSSSASTDTKFDAAVYSYSRSKGLFAGLTINGSKLAADNEANAAFYDSDATPSSIFSKNTSSGNAGVTALKNAVEEF
jgi:SH3 domain-containing YSC84-like protein 1